MMVILDHTHWVYWLSCPDHCYICRTGYTRKWDLYVVNGKEHTQIGSMTSQPVQTPMTQT